MENSWIITVLTKDRKDVEYIYLCSCSNKVHKNSKDSSYTCNNCKNSVFIDVNDIEKDCRKLKFSRKDRVSKDTYTLEYFFKKPYIDAESNSLKIAKKIILKMVIDHKKHILIIEKKDSTILEFEQIHDNRLQKIDNIIYEDMLPTLIEKYYEPRFDMFNLTYHIPKNSPLSLQKELINFYSTQC